MVKQHSLATAMAGVWPAPPHGGAEAQRDWGSPLSAPHWWLRPRDSLGYRDSLVQPG